MRTRKWWLAAAIGMAAGVAAIALMPAESSAQGISPEACIDPLTGVLSVFPGQSEYCPCLSALMDRYGPEFVWTRIAPQSGAACFAPSLAGSSVFLLPPEEEPKKHKKHKDMLFNHRSGEYDSGPRGDQGSTGPSSLGSFVQSLPSL